MLKIRENTKVFVYCPANAVTGGAELLHQLVDILNNNNLNAFIVYFGEGELKIPTAYNIYNIKLADKVEDNVDNIVVFYEAVFDKIQSIKYSQKCLWWLSVDNFFICAFRHLIITDLFKYNFRFGVKMSLVRVYELFVTGKNTFKNNISIKDLIKLNAINAYQSEYAQNFLSNIGFNQTYALSDYINTDFYSGISTSNREDVILYNPKKGLDFTKKLIAKTPQFQWVPVQNMSREELVKMFNKSKLYVDFGYHPGKDRLPREVALNGCCVITGMKGSARFFEDVPIENHYKFDQDRDSLDSIIERIQNVLTNYESNINNFDYYRKQILREKELFIKQVKILFLIEK